MRLRPLSLAELERLHRTEMREDFPPEELKPFAAMRTLYEAGAYRPMGAFEGETLQGYALLWDSPEKRYILVDYLGVPREKRNAGRGGQIMRLLAESFRDRDGILVESEAPEGGPEDALRLRRMDFYRRCGFAFLSYECMLFGVRYAVCLLSPNGRGAEAEALEAHKGLYRAQFTEAAYRRYIQIPRDPDRPLEPPESWADQENLPGLGERSQET